ncbi:hypothetical protein BH23PAT1_BH23PAT1_3500 [soil metagenome]
MNPFQNPLSPTNHVQRTSESFRFAAYLQIRFVTRTTHWQCWSMSFVNEKGFEMGSILFLGFGCNKGQDADRINRYETTERQGTSWIY